MPLRPSVQQPWMELYFIKHKPLIFEECYGRQVLCKYIVFSCWYVLVARIPKISYLKSIYFQKTIKQKTFHVLYKNMNQINLAPFTITLGILHVVIFIVSIILNLLASDYASYGRKLGQRSVRLVPQSVVFVIVSRCFENKNNDCWETKLECIPIIILLFGINIREVFEEDLRSFEVIR